jgi:hypothetical protein
MKKLLSLLLLPIAAQAQIDTTFTRINFEDNLIEEIENIEIEDENDFVEELSEFYENQEKININDLSTETAFSILKMSDYQYYQLQKYIAEKGFLITIYELATVEGFTVEYVQQIEKYIIVATVEKDKKTTFKSLFKRPKQKLLLRYSQILEKKAGYDENRNTHYVGTPQQYVFRYSFTASEHISLGYAGKKMPVKSFLKALKNRDLGFILFICK